MKLMKLMKQQKFTFHEKRDNKLLMTQGCLIPYKNGKPKNYKLIRRYI